MVIRKNTDRVGTGFYLKFDREKHFFQLIEKASELVVSNLDYDQTMRNIVNVLLDGFATSCYLNLVNKEGFIQGECVAIREHKKIIFKKDKLINLDNATEINKCLFEAVLSETSVLCSPLSCRRLVNCAHQKILNQLNSQSFICVPLKARDIIVGSLLLESKELIYNFQDLEFANKIAKIIALAIDNARIFKSMSDAVKVRDEFFANLSHELRTPLNVIQGWIKVLQSEKLDRTNFQKVLKTLERNSELQASLVKELVDINRISNNKFILEKKDINLTKIVTNVFETLDLQAQEKGIILGRECGSAPLIVKGDEDNLQRVFLNIIGNAIKFTPNGGMVNVALRSEKGFAIVEIKDSGCGISEKFLLKIFDSFCQESSWRDTNKSGLGLGLTIAKKIVELHGGTIKASSSGKNEGSLFEVSLPLEKNRQQGAKSKPLLKNEKTESLTGITALIVDDSEDVRFLITRYLAQTGVKVLEAESAEQAFQMVKQQCPDVMICDIAMPSEDGYSLIKRMRHLPANQGGNIKAIALTAYVDSKNKQTAFASGFDMYLVKPIFQKELIEGIIKLLK